MTVFPFESADKGLRIFIAECIADVGHRFGGIAQHMFGFLDAQQSLPGIETLPGA